MPLKRDNDEERLERISRMAQESARPLRADPFRVEYREASGGKSDDETRRNLGWLPVGYRVVPGTLGDSVECDRGCGWRQTVETLRALPRDARDQLFRRHEDWHVNRR
jgi:hypothetical protein